MSGPRWQLAPALIQLRTETNARWPRRDTRSDGTIGDVAHQRAGTSDHLPNPAGIVHAIDLDAWDDNVRDPADDVAAGIAEHLRATRDPRVKYVIWNGRMLSSYPAKGVPAWVWRPYTGPNPHTQHVHVSVLAAHAHNTAPWRLLTAAAMPKPPEKIPAEIPVEDDDMADRLHLLKGARTPDIYQLDVVTGARRPVPWAEMMARKAIDAWDEPKVIDQGLFDALAKGTLDLEGAG